MVPGKPQMTKIKIQTGRKYKKQLNRNWELITKFKRTLQQGQKQISPSRRKNQIS